MTEANPPLLSQQPRKKLIEKEQRQYYQFWKMSGLSKSAFCKQHAIAAGTFYAWCDRYERDSTVASGFSPIIAAVKTASPAADSIDIELTFPNQLQVRLCLREDRLVSFLQELCHATATIR
jgi:hypothetical protein